MYITKHDKEIIEYINIYVETHPPEKGFYKWVNREKYYLGFKQKNICKCGKCKFQYETNKKINQYDTCPSCGVKLLLKRFNIKKYQNKNYLNYLQKYEDKYGEAYLVRQFELIHDFYGYYDDSNINTYEVHFQEIGRQIIYKSGHLGIGITPNTIRRNISGNVYNAYWEDIKYWKPYDIDQWYGKYYPGNVDEILEIKYFNLEEYVNACELLNICDVIGKQKDDYVFEMLIKSKLYNLATYSYKFKKGKFEKVFGIDKSYLNFMQENNITFDELEVLKKIKIKDISLIRYLDSFGYYLDSLLKYCKPVDLYRYKLNSINVHEYLDYLNMAKKLKYNLKDKKILYPVNLKEEHNKLQSLIEIKRNKKITKKIQTRYKILCANMYSNKKYIIFPAKSIEEMIDESKQQNNCVKTYAERFANGNCDIYFMRLIDNPKQSLVTVEVRNNKIVQKRIKNNQETTIEQNKFLSNWEKRVLLKENK